tara:strand:- start:4264 stop:4473 length:210 start_codon:yes stop_codon:yes gene_type:complete
MTPDDTLFNAELIEVVEVGSTLRVLTRVAGEPPATLVMEADSTIAHEHGVRPGAKLSLRLRGRSIRVEP